MSELDEDKLIKIHKNDKNKFLHLSPKPIGKLRSAHQYYITGFNSVGKPEGIWFAPGSEWLNHTRDNDIYPPCCYLYELNVDKSRLLIINNDRDMTKFDRRYSNYWPNLNYIHPESGGKIVVNDELIFRSNGTESKEELAAQGVIYLTREDAINGCAKYKEDPSLLDFFRYKDWNDVRREWGGVFFNNYGKNPDSMRRFWYQTLDITSGCIWDPNIIKDIKLYRVKTSPTSWTKYKGAYDDTTDACDDTSDLALSSIEYGSDDAPNDTANYIGGVETDGIDGSDTKKSSANGVRSHDTTISKLVPSEISECAIHLGKKANEPCATPAMVGKLREITGENGSTTAVVEAAKKIAGKKSEKEAIIALAPRIGREIVNRELALVHKVEGPTDSKLLSNINIDDTLRQWMTAFPGFFAYNFNMLDYAKNSFSSNGVVNQPDTLATIAVEDLFDGSFDGKTHTRAACVINSDVYSGPGKHWMALFVERGSAGDVNTATCEFFNSSGNAPAPEWINWMEKTKNNLEAVGIKCEIVRVSTLRHQNSKSECGVYSLFYIWARLNGVSSGYFSKRLPDQIMFEFRQHLFNDPTREKLDKFDWSRYNMTTKISWATSAPADWK